MASADNPGGFDLRKFFKRDSMAKPPPHPRHAGSFVPETSASFYAAGSPCFATYCPSYAHYLREEKPFTGQYSSISAESNVQNPIVTAHSDGSRLLALLKNAGSTVQESFTAASVPRPPTYSTVPAKFASTKSSRGRRLRGCHEIYDVDVRLPGEETPQLEVSPITVYYSDPVLMLGRQIAVNSSYICYGLRAGTIRILNVKTALRALLRGHTKRVTDMTFFSEDVHLVASASSDGRVFIRKIEEVFGDDGKMQITEEIVLPILIMGDWESIHPHLCWHSHNQDILFVGVGKYIMKVDVLRAQAAASSGGFSVEDPAKCHVEDPMDGVSYVGKHDGEITGLSFGQWITDCLASSSKDGMVQVWGDREMCPLLTLKPHNGQPVDMVAFLTRPQHPDYMILLTAGPFNRELKLWLSGSSDVWSSPVSGKWQCIQTLELISSSESRNEHSFFNQALLLPHANLVLLANAKKNAIYVVHVQYGSNPMATRMDYLAEFSVTMPILSLTATDEKVADGKEIVQIYCVQTQAIQQHALDLSQCLPPSVILSEGGSASHLHEKSTSYTFMPSGPSDEDNIGDGRARKSLASYASSNRSSAFLSTLGPSDTKIVVSVASSGPTKIAYLPSEFPPPSSLRPLLRESQSERQSMASGSGIAPVCSSVDKVNEEIVQASSEPESLAMTSARIISSDALATQPKMDVNLEKEDEKKGQMDVSAAVNASISIECQASSSSSHLITPSQLMPMVVHSSESILSSQKASRGYRSLEETHIYAHIRNSKLETKEVNWSGSNEFEEKGFQKKAESKSIYVERNEMIFGSEALESITVNAKDSSFSVPITKSNDMMPIIAAKPGKDEMLDKRRQSACVEEIQEKNGMSVMVSVPVSIPVTSQALPAAKGRKNSIKTGLNSATASSSPVTEKYNNYYKQSFTCDGELSSTITTTSNPSHSSTGDMAKQVLAMQEALDQLVAMQKELQNQMTVMVSVPVAKEGKKVEAAHGQHMEKALNAKLDAMWARIQEENAKYEKFERERVQQMRSLLSNSLTKDLPVSLEQALKKEFASLASATAHIVCPSMEKALAVAINDNFQKVISEKTIMELEKSVATKLEPMVSCQIQTQFQASGRQALQDSLRSCFEGSVVPAIEHSCRAMFEQVDAAFQKGMTEHISSAQQHSAVFHTPLASMLEKTIASASSLVQSLEGEVSDDPCKLLALAESAGARCARVIPFSRKQNNRGFGGLPDKAISLEHLEECLDPTKELSRLVSDCKFEEAFHRALQMSDVCIVSWLCNQVDLGSFLSAVPPPLSQGVLLSLVQQLGCDIGQDTGHKLVWIREAAIALNPNDPVVSVHMRPILEQLYQNVHRLVPLVNLGSDANSLRLLLHVVNSVLTACK